MASRQPIKRTILVCGRCTTGRQNTKQNRLENSCERRWFGRTNIISWPCFLGCTRRECQISYDIVENYTKMFESRIYAGAKEKLSTRASGKHDAEIKSSWSLEMEGHAKKGVERYCEFAKKSAQKLHKVTTPCINDHQIKEEGELSTVCSQIVLKCLYLAPDILWSVNKLARAVTKCTKSCDKR